MLCSVWITGTQRSSPGGAVGPWKDVARFAIHIYVCIRDICSILGERNLAMGLEHETLERVSDCRKRLAAEARRSQRSASLHNRETVSP